MKLLEVLREKNRTLLEMHIGMIFFGLVCQLVGMILFFTGIWKMQNPWNHMLGLWFGIAAAMVSACHMYRTLDRSLDYGEAATKMIFKGYIFRYVLIVLIMLIIIMTEVMNPLVVFLGYMSLKVTALIQPITHKLCNKVFHETDPEPQPLIEEGQSENAENEQNAYAENEQGGNAENEERTDFSGGE